MSPCSPSWIRLAALWALVAGAVSCASPGYRDLSRLYYNRGTRKILAMREDLLDDRGRDALLGVQSLLSSALVEHGWQLAEASAVRASTIVNIFTAGEKGERDALGLLGREAEKPFKGEPHERMMVDYYLGVLRLQEGDVEGALAAFRSAIQKDRGQMLLPVEVSEARERDRSEKVYLFDDDLALLNFLAAKCYQLLGEPENAAQHLERARLIQPKMSALYELGMRPESNAIVLVEVGQGPVKTRAGPDGAELDYRRGWTGTIENLWIGERGLTFGLAEDLYFQATTLGGRLVDELNREKSAKKEALASAGVLTTIAGEGLLLASLHSRGRSREALGIASAAAFVVGLGAIIFSEAIDPRADIRTWSALPDQIYLGVGEVPAGEGTITVEGQVQGRALLQEWTGVPVRPGLNVFWLRMLPEISGGNWIPHADTPVEGQPLQESTQGDEHV